MHVQHGHHVRPTSCVMHEVLGLACETRAVPRSAGLAQLGGAVHYLHAPPHAGSQFHSTPVVESKHRAQVSIVVMRPANAGANALVYGAACSTPGKLCHTCRLRFARKHHVADAYEASMHGASSTSRHIRSRKIAAAGAAPAGAAGAAQAGSVATAATAAGDAEATAEVLTR